jgi:hypothetical protein
MLTRFHWRASLGSIRRPRQKSRRDDEGIKSFPGLALGGIGGNERVQHGDDPS